MVAPYLTTRPPWMTQQAQQLQQPWAAPASSPTLWQQATGQAQTATVGNTGGQTWVAPVQASPYSQTFSPLWQTPNLPAMPPYQGGGTQPFTPTGSVPFDSARMGMGSQQPGQVGQTPATPAVPQTGQAGVQNTPVVGEFQTAGAHDRPLAGWWPQNGGYLGGDRWAGDHWERGGPIAAGTDLAQFGISTRSGFKLPVGYNSAADTGRYELNGHVAETGFSRAIRKAMDAYQAGQDWDTAIANAINLVNQEAAQQGRTSGFAGNATPGQNAGTPPGSAPPATGTPPTTATPPGNTAPTGGAPQTRYFGQFGTDDLATLLQAAANDPDRAAQILRLARGQGQARPTGRLADFRDSLYGRAFQTALGLAGADGFGTLEGMANNFLNQGVLGNNLLGVGADLGRRVANMDFKDMDSATMEKMLRAGLALEGMGMGSLGGAVQSGRLEDIIYRDWARNLADSSNDTRNFADLLNGSAFQRAMRQFGLGR